MNTMTINKRGIESAVELVERMAQATSNEEREALRARLAALYDSATVIRTAGGAR